MNLFLRWGIKLSCHFSSYPPWPPHIEQRVPKDTKGYQRIPEDTSTIHAMDGPAFLAFPLLPTLTSLHWRGGLGHRKDTRGHQKITRAYKLSRTFRDGGSSCPGLSPPTHPHLLLKGADSPVPPEFPLCCARPGIKTQKRIWNARGERERFATK